MTFLPKSHTKRNVAIVLLIVIVVIGILMNVHIPKFMHIHPKIVGRYVPANVGIDKSLWNDHSLDYLTQGSGMSPLHTHDDSGMIHVEANDTYEFKLSDFFAIWGQPMNHEDVVLTDGLVIQY